MLETPEPVASVFSLLLGGVLGYGIAFAFQKLKRSSVSGSTCNEDFTSEEALVLLPLNAGQRGKIRITMANGFHDLVAITKDNQALKRGDKVLVIAVENGIACVSRLTPKLEDSQKNHETMQNQSAIEGH